MTGCGNLTPRCEEQSARSAMACTNDDDDDVGGTERIQSPGPKVCS